MSNCILYLHHRDDNQTWENYKKLCQFHPESDVVPVAFDGFSVSGLTRETVISSERNKKLTTLFDRGEMDYFESLAWCSVHELVIGGYKSNPNYDTYTVVEYDVFFNCPLNEFFEEPEHEVTFVKPMSRLETDGWEWTNLYKQVNIMWPEVQSVWRGAGVTALQNYTNGALEKIEKKLLWPFYDGMLSELAMGTAANVCRLDVGKWELLNGKSVDDYFQPNCNLLSNFKKSGTDALWYHPDKV